MMEPSALLKLLREEGIAHVAQAQVAMCKRCGFREDLRMGACFQCSDYVGGKSHGDGIHELWDKNNSTNRWFVMVKP